jgi:hypothetical protein
MSVPGPGFVAVVGMMALSSSQPQPRQPLPPERRSAPGGSGLFIRLVISPLVLRSVPAVQHNIGEVRIGCVFVGQRLPFSVGSEVEPEVARVAQAGSESAVVAESC